MGWLYGAWPNDAAVPRGLVNIVDLAHSGHEYTIGWIEGVLDGVGKP
jgi:hypothetical protein